MCVCVCVCVRVCVRVRVRVRVCVYYLYRKLVLRLLSEVEIYRLRSRDGGCSDQGRRVKGARDANEQVRQEAAKLTSR